MVRSMAVDSIYDRYLDDAYTRDSVVPNLTATEPGALAPPIPRRNQSNGRNFVNSTADTASVYTTATTPYERWSLEQGLDSRQSAYHRQSTHRPPDSPSLSRMRSMPANNPNSLPRLQTNPSDPSLATMPTHTQPSPIPSQQPRRHFSRPFRPEETLAVDPAPPIIVTPTITVAHHRFSASSPDAYGGAAFSPAPPAAGEQKDNDDASPRSSTYSTDIAAFPDPSHLRKRSNPTNSVRLDTLVPAKRGSLQSVKDALVARHGPRNSLGDLSVIESVDENLSEKPKASPRPFSPVNIYPFTTPLNAIGNKDRVASPKPSSRFSDDEKRAFQTLSENNDYQTSAWNLFGRSPRPLSSQWMPPLDKHTPGAAVAAASADRKRRHKRKMLFIAGGVILLLALAGAGSGIGVWRSNAARMEQNAAKLNGQGSGASQSNDVATQGGQTASPSASSASPASTAVPGSGGAGGYYTILTLGGSYADNGHTRPAQFQTTLAGNGYDQGRWSNGLVFGDYLATMVGPQSASGGDAVGLNYAYSGSYVNNSLNNAIIPDLPQQISSYLGDLNHGNETVSETGVNKTLVTVWAGMEQLIALWQDAMTNNPDNVLQVCQSGADVMIATLTRALGWMIPSEANAVIPDFALVSLPLGSTLPRISTIANNNQNMISIFGNITSYFNTGLSNIAGGLSPRTTVYSLNAESFLGRVVANATAYDITNTNQACLVNNCTDPNSYFWYDGINPSSTVHRLIARRLAQAILKTPS